MSTIPYYIPSGRFQTTEDIETPLFNYKMRKSKFYKVSPIHPQDYNAGMTLVPKGAIFQISNIDYKRFGGCHWISIHFLKKENSHSGFWVRGCMDLVEWNGTFAEKIIQA